MSEEDTGTGVLKLIPLRVETGQPANNWEMVWEMARQSKLEPALATFLFKLLHQILPTAERVSRILPNQSPLCTRCKCNPQAVETLEHAMFECSENNGVSTVLLNGLKTILPDLTKFSHSTFCLQKIWTSLLSGVLPTSCLLCGNLEQIKRRLL